MVAGQKSDKVLFLKKILNTYTRRSHDGIAKTVKRCFFFFFFKS